jgi:hypothetical protein
LNLGIHAAVAIPMTVPVTVLSSCERCGKRKNKQR